jgi:hypothetical protein
VALRRIGRVEDLVAGFAIIVRRTIQRRLTDLDLQFVDPLPGDEFFDLMCAAHHG